MIGNDNLTRGNRKHRKSYVLVFPMPSSTFKLTNLPILCNGDHIQQNHFFISQTWYISYKFPPQIYAKRNFYRKRWSQLQFTKLLSHQISRHTSHVWVCLLISGRQFHPQNSNHGYSYMCYLNIINEHPNSSKQPKASKIKEENKKEKRKELSERTNLFCDGRGIGSTGNDKKSEK